VLDLDGRFLRAQVKTGRLRNGCIRFATRSVRSNRNGNFKRDYRGEIELFLVYCAEIDRVYAVPVEAAPSDQMSLRVQPSRNGQRVRVNVAEHYELPA
jgi:PD-(D/E)XK endonuclease